MGSNVRNFNLALAKHGAEIPSERVQQIHRAVALEGLRGVVLMSPVDRGRFKGNWQQSIDTPATGTLDREDKTGAATIAEGERVIAQIPPFGVSWTVNNLDYAQALEDGHSQQAPAGVLAVTAARLRAWLARVR